jgi:hypothetical protein
MQNKLEKLIKMVYKKWRSDIPGLQEPHPDEQAIACFLENRLSKNESESIKMHLINCDICAERVAMQLKLKPEEDKEVPGGLIAAVRDLVSSKERFSALEIFLRLKNEVLQLLDTTGDVLVGQELVPAPLLRSRHPKGFQDEITILKDFGDIRVEAKIENKKGQAFSLTVIVKEKPTQEIMKDLRVTLIKDDVELESYITDSGKVTFEHVLLGRYSVEISSVDNKIASVILDIKT